MKILKNKKIVFDCLIRIASDMGYKVVAQSKNMVQIKKGSFFSFKTNGSQ